jgi:type IV pilus assembly protein PilX
MYRQRGAALITSLIFVLVISTLGISIAKQVINQRKMSSSHYDQMVTFSDAESGIQDGEAVIELYATDLATLISQPGVTSAAFATDDWWKKNSNWANAATATNGGVPLHGTPIYIIENMGVDNGRRFFRVTARSTGTGGANSFLQTTYAILEP